MDAPLLTARRAARLWLPLVLGAAACLTPTDPHAGRVAELRVRAGFAQGSEPAALGVTVDSAAVIAVPVSGGPAAVDTTVPMPDLDAVLSWIVALAADSVPHDVALALRGGGRALYEGSDRVVLHRLPLGEAPVHDVPVRYVGPGAVATVTVTPGTVTLTAAGATQQYAAEARDADGTPVSTTFTWSSADDTVATVDPATGLASAVMTGVTTISATAGGVTGSATLTVAVGGITVEVTPSSATIPALNGTRRFTATARDGSGTEITNARFVWTTGDSAIATVDTTGVATGLAEGRTRVTAETGGVAADAALLVTVVTAVEVTPANATLAAVGDTLTYSAVARDATGAAVPDVQFAWRTADTAVASVEAATGLLTARGNGTTAVLATAGTAEGAASLTVTQAVATLEVTPASATLTSLGATQAFTATARDANGNPVATPVSWSSADTAVAVVDPVTGVATAVASGEATITAEAGGVTAHAQLLVAPGGLSVEVMPGSATLTALGQTRQFTATARDGGGTPIPGVTFEWLARDSGVVAVDGDGLATALGEGATWVTARVGGALDSADVLVAVATTVEVTPAAATLAALGATERFTATARDAGGAAIPGAVFTWTSSDSGTALIDPTLGVATAVGNGTTTIEARTGDAEGTAGLTVLQAVAGIAVTPPNATLTALDATAQFTAAAVDAGGAVVTRPVQFVWTSTDPGVATVDSATGLASAVADGTIGILAAAEGVVGGASLTVDQVAVTVTVDPATATITSVGDSLPFTATGRDANGFVVADAAFTWTSDDPAVATVTASGVATALTAGTTTIRATETDGAAGAAQLVVDPEIVEVDVQPGADTLRALDATLQLTAVGRDAGGTMVAGARYTWSSSDPAVASVDGTGLVTAHADGRTLVVATAATGVADTAVIDVVQEVTTVEVTPDSALLDALGSSQTFTAVARDANGFPVPAAAFVWTSGQPAVATVDPLSGVVTAVADGRTLIGATAGGVTGSATLTVAQAVASVAVAPADTTLTLPGETVLLAATAQDANGHPVPGAIFLWASSDTTVAVVDSAGMVTALRTGIATISATSGPGTGTSVVRICLGDGSDDVPACR